MEVLFCVKYKHIFFQIFLMIKHIACVRAHEVEERSLNKEKSQSVHIEGILSSLYN